VGWLEVTLDSGVCDGAPQAGDVSDAINKLTNPSTGVVALLFVASFGGCRKRAGIQRALSIGRLVLFCRELQIDSRTNTMTYNRS
jgi:hypothetical protein